MVSYTQRDHHNEPTIVVELVDVLLDVGVGGVTAGVLHGLLEQVVLHLVIDQVAGLVRVVLREHLVQVCGLGGWNAMVDGWFNTGRIS